MLINVLMIFLGFAALVFGANQLIKGATNIAHKFHVPSVIIGLTIVAIGTSLPELIITIISAAKGSTDLIIGNVLGSNVCNLLLVLGIMAIIKPVETDKETRRIHIPVLIVSTIIVFCMGLGVFAGEKLTITNTDGIILILLGISYFLYPIIKEIIENRKNKENKDINEQGKQNNIFTAMINILIGSILLKYGGDLVVNYSTRIAEMFHISEKVIGLTIVAFGTSLPELVTSIIAIIKNDEDLALGNIIGSCIMNLLFILGIGAIISPLSFGYGFNQTIFLLIASTILIWLYSMAEGEKKISRHNGIALVSIFLLYFIKLFVK